MARLPGVGRFHRRSRQQSRPCRALAPPLGNSSGNEQEHHQASMMTSKMVNGHGVFCTSHQSPLGWPLPQKTQTPARTLRATEGLRVGTPTLQGRLAGWPCVRHVPLTLRGHCCCEGKREESNRRCFEMPWERKAGQKHRDCGMNTF